MEKIKVGVVGYGTIGKRVADAVGLQPDMELIGITARTYNYRIEAANEKGIPIYLLGDDSLTNNGIQAKGTFSQLLQGVDVIVDCSPKPCGMKNREMYMNAGVKAVFQGGEKKECGDVSFVAQCNYKEGVGKNFIRVVSCNTTGLGRTLKALDSLYGIESCRATLIRRGTDPGESGKGPINAIIPSMELPSHHGPDVSTVLPGFEVITTAVTVPTTIMHVHQVSVKVKGKPVKDEIVNAFRQSHRIRLVRAGAHIISTAQVLEYGRDLGFSRGDMMDICVWEESISVRGDEIFYMQAIHQESDVVPENIDAIRAAMGYEDGDMSMSITNRTLRLA